MVSTRGRFGSALVLTFLVGVALGGAGCGGREMSFVFDLTDCGSEVAFIEVYLLKPDGVLFCVLDGPKSLGPDSSLEFDGLDLAIGETVRLQAIGRRSGTSSDCLCVGLADRAVTDGKSETIDLTSDFNSCSAPLKRDCD